MPPAYVDERAANISHQYLWHVKRDAKQHKDACEMGMITHTIAKKTLELQ